MAFDKLNPHQRTRFHAMFERWTCSASEQEYEEFINLRELIAPGEVCSVIRIALTCIGDPVMINRLPASLREALKEENWPVGFAAA